MSTVIACWSRLGKRWSVPTAAALGLCLWPRWIDRTADRSTPGAVVASPRECRAARPARGGSCRSRIQHPSRSRLRRKTPPNSPTSANAIAVESDSRSRRAGSRAHRRDATRTGASQKPLLLQLFRSPLLRRESQILKEHFARLKSGRERFSRLPGYTATLAKQERIGSDLLEEITFGIKVRHQPFSVYMKWQSGDEVGKEVLYVDGTNEDQLLVRLGGIEGTDPSRP